MKPYYSSPGGTIVVYHARWEDVVGAGLVPVREVALVHADPPTGEGLSDTRRNGCGEEGERGRRKSPTARVEGGRTRMFPPIFGDFEPFDPGPLLALGRPTVFWCAMHFADRLPPSRSWLVWDKREGRGLRKTEKQDKHHPTQKPVALASWTFRERAKLPAGSLIFVPFGGSMPEIAVPGFRYIVCEVELEYVRSAVGARLHAAPVADAPGPLFATVRP